MKRLLILSIIITSVLAAFAQGNWSVADIPDSLKRDANSVIRSYELNVTATSQKALTMHHHVVITVLNKKGESHASWNCITSMFEKLTSFSGKVYNEQGKIVSKIKQSDVHKSQYSEHLATDNQHNYVSPPLMDYPYTVEYEWEIKASNGYVEYGFLSPIDHSRQALQQACFVLTVPTGTGMKHLSMPYQRNPEKQTAGKNDQYTWIIPAMRGLLDDDYEDYALYILPSVLAVPQNFTFGESSGTLESWENFGRWYAQLSEGRGFLLPADVQKVGELTANCSNDREKIEALYKYLGEKTRYVSIQLGIGGWQPMTAQEVGKTGFGDCKALTNYMQALLREAGITSYHTIISTVYQDLLKGFPNLHQTDHVILTVPQQDGSNLVIECTNPQLPLGFIPGSYAGHEALQVREDGGRLIRIDDYTPENNYERLKANVLLREDATSQVSFDCDHYGERYGNVRTMKQEGEKERKDIVARWINLKDPVVTEATVYEEISPVPHLNVYSKVNVTYGDKHGDKIFITCNPFRNIYVPRLRKGRQRPLVINSTVTFHDNISITLPEGYFYKEGNYSDSKTTEFGSYSFSINQEDSILNISTNVSLQKGRFDISKATDFINFRESISKMMKRILILEKR